MEHHLWLLSVTAASLGFFHTLLGPDHYVPFVVMSKAGRWSAIKTFWITFLCGVGHILSSVLLGCIGIALGIAVSKLEWVEAQRGEIAAWALIAFGFVYLVWGIRQGILNKPHTHFHAHEDGETHVHQHLHRTNHVHLHSRSDVPNMTPWILFTIFVFGPCEPLIPLLMYPAANSSVAGVMLVTLVFGGTTILTMLALVGMASYGIHFLPVKLFERYVHAFAGGTLLMCGVAMQFLGL